MRSGPIPRINEERLLQRLHDLAQIGATPEGGVTRLALSDEDRAGRDLLASWMSAAGLDLRVDEMGNMTGYRQGRTAGPPVLIGSHADTVLHGGKYDGAYGVLGALEAIETLNDFGIETERGVALVNWTNEEGVRFEPAMTCSGVAAGRFTAQEIYAKTDREGLRFDDELHRIGYLGDAANRPLPAAAYIELHIEQGPVLEAADQPVGIVGGIVGITWSEVTIQGQADHAGPSPMHLRHDALTAAAHIITGVERLAIEQDETAVATVGRLVITPNIINTIPGRAVFSVDFRHRDPAVLELQVDRLRNLVNQISQDRGVNGQVNRFWTSEPTPFDPTVVSAIRSAVSALGLPEHELWSGAGHDAKYVADVCPAGMIFIRSQGGLSHCETESSSDEDLIAGANVLLLATLELAG
jgi:beta-ureidopropionase / N-carbamoyl-L-amino-acid hydrolase